MSNVGKIESGHILILLGYLAGTFAYAQTAQDIARNAFESTVLLVMEDANHLLKAICPFHHSTYLALENNV